MADEMSSGGSSYSNVPPKLPINNEDPEAAFRRLIEWSFAVAPLFGRRGHADGGRTGYATKGEVEGDVQFAPEEDIPSLPTFAQQNPQESIRAALEAAKSLPEKREATLSAYEPTIGEKIYGAVAGLGSERPSPERRRFAEGVSELAGLTPGLGNVMAAQEAKRAGERGSYGEMALASLGALPMVGPTEKKAAETAVNVARRLTDLGHYSPAAEAVASLKQEKGPASQMLGALKNLPGVKPEELKWSGIEGAFQPSETVTRQQIMDYLHENLPQVKETTLGRDRINLVQNEEEPHIFEVYHAGDPEGQHYGQVGEIVQNPAGRYTVNVPGLSRHNFATVDEARDYINRTSDIGSTTKYHSYTLPGGENYREVLMHLPENLDNRTPLQIAKELFNNPDLSSIYKLDDDSLKVLQKELDKQNQQNISGNYKSSHWGEPNVLGHLRMSDRTGPEGEKILHLEELQSDWGQAGRKQGFHGEKTPDSVTGRWDVIHHHDNGQDIPYSFANRQEAEDWHNRLSDMGLNVDRPAPQVIPGVERERTVPPAPYVTNTQGWTDLGLKRALREAAEGGYDKMIWTPGAEQAARYDLSKHIDSLSWSPKTNELIGLKNDRAQFVKTARKEELADLVGKDVADKLVKSDTYEINQNPWHRLEGTDLSVGGEGMKSFYDKIVPTQLSKLIKKLDPNAKIEMSGHKLKGKEGNDVNSHVLHITPELRKRILEGLPAYERGGSIVDHALEVLSKHRK